MLRYFYILSLLTRINFSFCYEYSSDKDLNKASIIRRLKADHPRTRENLQYRKDPKRHDYDVYDKDPVAEIDVANFINSAEDESISENDPYNLRNKKLRYGKNYNSYGSLTNEISNSNEDYLDTYAENVQGNPHYMNVNLRSEDKIINGKLIHGYDKTLQNNLDDNVISQNNRHRKEKKCALKNIKLPFFSHNKSAIAKNKNESKRKIYGVHNAKKGNINYKGRDENLLKQDNSRDNSNIHDHDKVKKRSYFERLCPVCRRKFILSKTRSSQSKRRNASKNRNSNIQKNVESNAESSNILLNKYDVDPAIPTSNEEREFRKKWYDKRRKREDNYRNIERLKELEFIQKRVESVTVNNPSYNKAKL